MYHFFVEPGQVHDTYVEILGGDVNHMKNVLRMRVGEEIAVNDGSGVEYRCRVESYAKGTARAAIVERQVSAAELPARLVLYQCLPKGDRMELIIQKAVELGASAIVPVSSARCVVKLDEAKAQKKRERWQEIARSAAKQSGRSLVPGVEAVQSFSEALKSAQKLDVRLFPYENERSPMERTREILSGIQKGQSVGVFIGPEGGFEHAEADAAVEAGAIPITLGRRILRTETAAISILSVLMFYLEV
ncbi:MAG: 16S rRNA (uracil(1498)-N(3))-methyltransferase [Lachnospiraceae bacterium]|nr:16S rRNA (uracil(1498)-N(3))-methyltransferase [Lachnospiraceae bacterium]